MHHYNVLLHACMVKHAGSAHCKQYSETYKTPNSERMGTKWGMLAITLC